MHLADDRDEADFRRRLRHWLAENAPGWNPDAPTDVAYKAMVQWQHALFRAGWAGLSWPREYGGQGLGPIHEAILSQELALVEAPPLPPLGYLGRALLHFGRDDQKRRYLRPLLAGEELWCQGFSEPSAGSDLANLRTSATQDADGFVVNGHKIWTSYAQFADYCLLLARTDPDGPRHKSITALLLPMRQTGVSISPITQSNGHQEFAEVFFDGARADRDAVLGDLGGGWPIAMATIGYERGAVDIGYQAKFERMLAELGTALGEDADADARRSLGRAAAAVEVLRLHSMRSLSQRARGIPPGPEASIDKLLMTEAEQRLTDVAMRHADPLRLAADGWTDRYLYSRAASVYGGTSQIQRGIISQRLLGLPR